MRYKLTCNAFTVEGDSITDCVLKWNKFRHGVDRYADTAIQRIESVDRDGKPVVLLDRTDADKPRPVYCRPVNQRRPAIRFYYPSQDDGREGLT
jgi:hypothetical protein